MCAVHGGRVANTKAPAKKDEGGAVDELAKVVLSIIIGLSINYICSDFIIDFMNLLS